MSFLVPPSTQRPHGKVMLSLFLVFYVDFMQGSLGSIRFYQVLVVLCSLLCNSQRTVCFNHNGVMA